MSGRAPGRSASLIEAALLTGCRLDELRRLERRNIDFGRRTLTLERTKNGHPRVIDMRDSLTLFERLPPFLGSPYVFWHADGKPYLNVSTNFRRLMASAQEVARKSAQPGTPSFRPFRFHDLRHRFAVDALRNGMSLYDLQRHLGHGSVQVTEGYLRYLTGDEASAATGSGGTKTGTGVAV